jgi:hypothetical protein
MIHLTDETWFDILNESTYDLLFELGDNGYERIARDVRSQIYIDVWDSVYSLIYRSTYEQN